MKLRRFAITGYAVGLMVGVGLILTYGAMEVSSTPAFCGSCHVMEPYYLSWKESGGHSNVACVECHIPPGITAELHKKYEALSMVARYFTATYGTNPWAEVEDSACLECHERRLLVGGAQFGDVYFDHGPHLTELRRGKRLRCTSCHSQMVQGSHIKVTETTCTLCHFRGQEAGTGTAECTLCHSVPSTVIQTATGAFDHSQVARLGMECRSCHAAPDPNQGGVPEVRCLTCHNDPERLGEFHNTDLLHRTHVSDHKVECTNCHLEIQHVAETADGEEPGDCSACHRSGHSAQQQLYAGIGGRGLEAQPDVMFAAGVRCEGCHLDHDARHAGAGEVACMSCHGAGYRSLYTSWSETVTTRLEGLERQLGQTRRAVRGDRPELDDAQANYELVRAGGGIHNVPYSLALLEAAHRQMNEARRGSGLGSLAAPWPQAPFESDCLECHAGSETMVARAFGRQFPHQPHVVGAGLDCRSCHSTHEAQDAGSPALKLGGTASCNSCHHSDASAACTSCHDSLNQRTYPVAELGEFSHEIHVDGMELPCSGCHGEGAAIRRKPSRSVCSDCH